MQNNSLLLLVKNLPEVYQPIYKHRELSADVSRESYDRLEIITTIHNHLASIIKRPLRVLDLGCAQGFFSLSLAELGATVKGIDYLEANIIVCKALTLENPNLNVEFEVNNIEQTILLLQSEEYDLVLGLSVFHHIVYGCGLTQTKELITNLSNKVFAGIFEVALQEEPLYWGKSQPKNSRELLDSFLFVHKLSEIPTHLSYIKRPLFFASNKFFLVNNSLGVFTKKQSVSHSLNNNVHLNTRNYFTNDCNFLKQYILDEKVNELNELNLKEYVNEINFLSKISSTNLAKNYPKLIKYENNTYELLILREKLEGELLSNIINRNLKQFDIHNVINQLLIILIELESINFYHNDLRLWNILLDANDKVSLIDYGAISSDKDDCVWPRNRFIVFFLLIQELTEQKIIFPHNRNFITLQFNTLPVKYYSVFKEFFSYPINDMSYKLLYQLLNDKCTNFNHCIVSEIFFEEFNNLSKIYQAEKIYLEDMVHEVTRRADESEKKYQAEKIYLEDMVHEVTRRADENQKKYESIIQSRFWRYTYWIRYIIDNIKRK